MKKVSPLKKYLEKKAIQYDPPTDEALTDYSLGTVVDAYKDNPWMPSGVPLIGSDEEGLGWGADTTGGIGGALLGAGGGYMVNKWRKEREIEKLMAEGYTRAEAEQMTGISEGTGAAVGAAAGGVGGYFGLPALMSSNYGWAGDDIKGVTALQAAQMKDDLGQLKPGEQAEFANNFAQLPNHPNLNQYKKDLDIPLPPAPKGPGTAGGAAAGGDLRLYGASPPEHTVDSVQSNWAKDDPDNGDPNDPNSAAAFLAGGPPTHTVAIEEKQYEVTWPDGSKEVVGDARLGQMNLQNSGASVKEIGPPDDGDPNDPKSVASFKAGGPATHTVAEEVPGQGGFEPVPSKKFPGKFHFAGDHDDVNFVFDQGDTKKQQQRLHSFLAEKKGWDKYNMDNPNAPVSFDEYRAPGGPRDKEIDALFANAGEAPVIPILDEPEPEPEKTYTLTDFFNSADPRSADQKESDATSYGSLGPKPKAINVAGSTVPAKNPQEYVDFLVANGYSEEEALASLRNEYEQWKRKAQAAK